MERRNLLKVLAGVGLTSLAVPVSPLLDGVFRRGTPGLNASHGPCHGGAAQAAQAAHGGVAGGQRLVAGAQGAAEPAAGTPAQQVLEAGLPDLVIARGRPPEELVKAAIEAIGGVGRFISKGDKVIVKPNVGWDRTPEQAANTNPEVVRTLVDLCFGAGAKSVLVVDNTCNEARRCYVRSGIAKAAEGAGASVKHIDEKRFASVKIGGEVLTDWPVYRDFLEVDKVINVPIAKHHSLCRLSLSMKNWLGAIGGNRSQLHQKIDESSVDLAAFFKPALTVLDAVRILKANGPQGGNLKDVEKLDTVAVSVDQVAIDSFGATLFGIKGEDLGCVKAAIRRGFGAADLSKIRVVEV